MQRLYYAIAGVCIQVFFHSDDTNHSVTLPFDDVIPWDEFSEKVVGCELIL